jgi:putative oxidoreductase
MSDIDFSPVARLWSSWSAGALSHLEAQMQQKKFRGSNCKELHGRGSVAAKVTVPQRPGNVPANFARWAALPLRFIVGYGFLLHGLAKWSRGSAAFAAILHAAGVPAPQLMAWATIATEIVGGGAFLLGAFISLVSLPSIVLLAVAIVKVHLPYGFSSIKLMGFNNGRAQFGPPGYECDLLYIACIVALVLSGPSPWSVDT